MPTHDLCSYCQGSGTISLPMYGGIEKCPQCNGTGVKLISREEEKERRRQARLSREQRLSPLGETERVEKWFKGFFGLSLALGIIMSLAILALIVAVIIALL